jgi:peptidoglycan hydrolase-like protein with peptidoglycan-binding domain/ribosomal protein S15P/S13E
MGKKYTAGSNKKHTFHAAKMLVAFQKRPGIAADRLIKDAGDAVFYKDGQPSTNIKPVNGIYAIPLQTGETGYLELFDTRYTVVSLASGTDSGLAKPAIVNWPLPLLSKDTLNGVQQRLQLLGYYTATVDGKMGRGTERAVLEFQADEGTLLIDGDPGPKTKTALDTYFTNNGMNASGVPIIRKYLIRFKRFASGHARWNSPHPDTRGGDTTVVSYFVLKGTVSWLLDFLGIKDSEQKFKFKMVRENFLPRNKDTYVSVEPTSAARLSVENASEVSTPSTIPPIGCVAKDTGDAKLQVHFGAANGPVIGEVDVKIVSLVQVKLYLHILDIKDNFGTTVVNKWTLQKAKELIGDINAIWAPIGIEFTVAGAKNHAITGEYPGTITNILNNANGSYISTEFYPLWQKYNNKDQINIYFANELLDEFRDAAGATVKINNNTMGYALSRKKATANGHVGVCVKFDSDIPMLARTIAHELGHIVELTSHPKAHSDDDGSSTPFRSDIWSRSRLMSKYIRQYDNNPHREWQDPDYGKSGNLMNCGALITIKKLKNDGTDDELKVARSASKNPY